MLNLGGPIYWFSFDCGEVKAQRYRLKALKDMEMAGQDLWFLQT